MKMPQVRTYPSIKFEELPPGWKMSGKGLHDFYFMDPKGEHIPYHRLGSDLVLMSNADESAFIDISWSPDHNPDGEYVCRVISAADWKNPRGEFRSIDAMQVMFFAVARAIDIHEGRIKIG